MTESGKIRPCRHTGGRKRIAIMVLGLLCLTGCVVVGPDYTRPAVPVPGQWNSAPVDGLRQDAQQMAQWWQILDDPVLSGLIHRAAAGNLEVKEALFRVRQARFQRLKSRAALFPELDVTGSARKSESSEDTGSGETSTLYTAGFDAGWEVDLFGGTRRAVEAARADVAAEVEDLNDVMVTLLAEVAVNYIDVRTYQARRAVAVGNVAAQQETWALLDALSRAGMGDELALAQARYNLESSRARLPDLEVGLEAAMNRLAVLTGQAPGSLHAELADRRSIPRVAIDLAVGIPADVLAGRPDIRRAERQLAAQTARIGEAEADLYPRFALGGAIGLEALSLGDLVSIGSRAWSLGPSFSWPVFDAGAIRNNIAVQTELQQQARVRYEATVLAALEEVENAMVAYAGDQQKLTLLRAAVDAARSAVELAKVQYTTGMTGFSDVLDAQRSLLSFEDELAQNGGAVASDLVRLYKTLGGGWQTFSSMADPTPSAKPSGSRKG